MQLLFAHADVMNLVLARFTLDDAKHYLSVVCRALNEATRRSDVKFMPFMTLDAALERLRRRYMPGLYDAVAALATTLYAQHAAGMLIFWEHATSKTTAPTILGFQGFWVLSHDLWREQLLQLASTHPAFRWPHAGRYAYSADRPPWCVYEVFRDFGLRCVAGTGAGGPYVARPRSPKPPCPLRYREWLFRDDVTYTELLRELRLLREA